MSVAQSCPTLCNPMDCSLPGRNTGVGCHSLLQGIFLTQGSNPGLLHCRRILRCLSHQTANKKGKPRSRMNLGASVSLSHLSVVWGSPKHGAPVKTNHVGWPPGWYPWNGQGAWLLRWHISLWLFPTRCCVCSAVSNSVAPWTIGRQGPLSMGFSRQGYWIGLPFPSPGDLPHPRIKHIFPASSALAGGFFTTEPPGKLSPTMRITKNSMSNNYIFTSVRSFTHTHTNTHTEVKNVSNLSEFVLVAILKLKSV